MVYELHLNKTVTKILLFHKQKKEEDMRDGLCKLTHSFIHLTLF